MDVIEVLMFLFRFVATTGTFVSVTGMVTGLLTPDETTVGPGLTVLLTVLRCRLVVRRQELAGTFVGISLLEDEDVPLGANGAVVCLGLVIFGALVVSVFLFLLVAFPVRTLLRFVKVVPLGVLGLIYVACVGELVL